MERIAPQIFGKRGVDFSTARRMGGWTNGVWMAGDLVLRVAPDKDSLRIRREAQLGAMLPGAVGYPEILETGVRDGHEWSLSRRVPGVNLGEAWPGLDWAARESALRALWDIVRAIHAVDPGAIPAALPRRTWYSDLKEESARADLSALAARSLFKSGEIRRLSEILDAFFDALPRAPLCLCHGDITMENMMWDEARLAAVLDFEHAALLPAQADVYSFLRLLFGPSCPTPPEAVAASGAARARVQTPDEASLLLGFAALISIRHMHLWLGSGAPGPHEDWIPYQCLASLADGRGGFLAPALEMI
jgi:aminoglycoside phosphotransferase (APT) family kinase protein